MEGGDPLPPGRRVVPGDRRSLYDREGCAGWNGPGELVHAIVGGAGVERAHQTTLDQICRALNARRGTPQETFLPGDVYLEIARTHLRMLRHDDAVAAFERGRHLGSDPVLLEELGNTYEAIEQPRKAAQAFVEALLMDSTRTHLNSKLMELYTKVDPQGCAVSREGGTPSLNLACPMVHGDICAASQNVARNYDQRNQTPEAASIRRVAVEDLGCTAESVK